MLFTPAIQPLDACEDELLLAAEKIKNSHLSNIHFDLLLSMARRVKHAGTTNIVLFLGWRPRMV
jgi:hypothetical protein